MCAFSGCRYVDLGPRQSAEYITAREVVEALFEDGSWKLPSTQLNYSQTQALLKLNQEFLKRAQRRARRIARRLKPTQGDSRETPTTSRPTRRV